MDVAQVEEEIISRATALERECATLQMHIDAFRIDMTGKIDDAVKSDILESLGKINARLGTIEERISALEPEE